MLILRLWRRPASGQGAARKAGGFRGASVLGNGSDGRPAPKHPFDAHSRGIHRQRSTDVLLAEFEPLSHACSSYPRPRLPPSVPSMSSVVSCPPRSNCADAARASRVPPRQGNTHASSQIGSHCLSGRRNSCVGVRHAQGETDIRPASATWCGLNPGNPLRVKTVAPGLHRGNRGLRSRDRRTGGGTLAPPGELMVVPSGLASAMMASAGGAWRLPDRPSKSRNCFTCPHASVMGSAPVGENSRSDEAISPELARITPTNPTIPKV